ncbi:MurR/RpiR family transcriptional regulator [Halobacillus amylolyticus]|uniref:MurR/RpiR family transcriptional regulator n=1 Tax=Halobacillus amylolyticus TaxID=2932259 RepID=A0ABY4H9T5_9BACI|nr:MurR/RpiR family transcriptional regulator [Halobacillus amylolyticus]UOR11620.1 MurR/RpiR family transcriptional regulator [Halobacillus amylolyticus]
MSYISGGLAMLKSIENTLPTSEQKIAKYILSSPQPVITMTVKELAEQSETSSAAVIRLCKSLDLKGFQELKMRIAGDVQKPSSSEYRDIDKGESIHHIIEQMTHNGVQILKETEEMLRREDVERAVQDIHEASSLHLFGIGASGLVAADGQQKFLRAGRYAFYLQDPHMSYTTLSNARENDVAIVVSFSGETKEAVQFIRLAKKNGMKTISITKYGSSAISQLADIPLYTSSTQEAMIRSAATSSRLAQLHVIDILFMSYVSSYYDEVIQSLDSSRAAIDEQK